MISKNILNHYGQVELRTRSLSDGSEFSWSPPSWGISKFLLILLWLERSRQRKALAGMSERLLRDIGISRVEALRESRKWFWQD